MLQGSLGYSSHTKLELRTYAYRSMRNGAVPCVLFRTAHTPLCLIRLTYRVYRYNYYQY